MAELKRVLKEDAGLKLNVNKTSVLPKGVLSGDVTIGSFCPEGFVGIGVPIGTDAFVQNFVAKTCRAIIDDVEKLVYSRWFHPLSAPQVLPGPPDYNILIATFRSVIDACYNSNMSIAKLLTHS